MKANSPSIQSVSHSAADGSDVKQRIAKVARVAGRMILAVNLGALVRTLRFGPGDLRDRLRRVYQLVDPFESRDALTGAPSSMDIKMMVRKYCVGSGLEVGPGNNPYCPLKGTVFVDKFDYADCRFKVQKIENAWELPFPDNHFDFLFTSHCLEHCPDTIGTLLEWCRVIRPGGRLVLILPHVFRTFDCGRTPTTLAHHIEDHQKRVGIDDPTHWDEIERISIPGSHHPWLDYPVAHLADGQLNRKWLYENGHIHYHVWRSTEMVELVRHLGCQVLFSRDKLNQRSDSFAVVAEVCKPQPSQKSV
jgi:SAM-dependent methyltransferase